MPAFARKWIVPLGLLLLVTAVYCVAARQEPRLTPIQEMEAVVELYELNYGAETKGQDRIVVSAEQRQIHVRPSWARVELEAGGASINGITAWNISVVGWDLALQRALLNALNDSPATAQQLVNHPDERVQFLLLKVLTDWGHNRKAIWESDEARNRKPWDLKPHAVEALLALAHHDDPHAVGTVISALKFKGKFSTEVFLAGMAHHSSDIRAQALRWLNPKRQQLTSAEIQAVAPVLIDHLSDRDLVVREWSLLSLQSLIAYWEQSLGGAPIDLARTNQEKMIRLPIAPASDRWHREVFPQISELARQYQAEWQAWLTKAEQSL